MSGSYKVYRVFIASPTDVQKERDIFKEVIDEGNDIKAHAMGIHLEPLAWEDTLPGKGRPQEIINKDIERSDYVVLLLWKRWGTPTAKYSSGVEEEYELAKSLIDNEEVRDMALYFRAIPDYMLEDPGEELKKVLAFREKVESEKNFLYKPYEDEKGWEKFIRARLYRWLDDLGGKGIKAPSATESQSVELPAELVKDITNTLLKEAVKKAENGEITKAEEFFIKATSLSSNTQALNLYAQFLLRIGLLDKAEEKLLQIEYIGEKTKDKVTLAIAYGNLGNIYRTRCDLDKAEKVYKKAFAISKELGLKAAMSINYENIGNVYQLRGNIDKAEELYEKSLAINKEFGRRKGMANNYGNLGNVYQLRGDFDKAEEFYEKTLAINKELGRKEDTAATYVNLGSVYQQHGDLDKAEELYEKSLAINKELGHKAGMAGTYGNLGNVYQLRGDLDKAEEMYAKSLAINKTLSRKAGMANTYSNLGILYKTSGDNNKAEEMYNKSLELFLLLGNKLMIEKLRYLLVELIKQKWNFSVVESKPVK